MTNDLTYCIVGGSTGDNYARLFKPFGKCFSIVNLEQLDLLKKYRAAFAVFTGGADVSPEYYGQKQNKFCFTSPHRDEFESAVFKECVNLGILNVGICRGAQLICALSGGTLCQDLSGHHGNHIMEINDGRKIYVNSIHHQMQLPPKDAEIIAWAEPKLSKKYIIDGQEVDEVEKEVECAWYPSTKGVTFQYHPEMMPETSLGVEYTLQTVSYYLAKIKKS